MRNVSHTASSSTARSESHSYYTKPDTPCLVCGETTKGCNYKAETNGMYYCRTPSPIDGWKVMGEDDEFTWYRRVGDTRTEPLENGKGKNAKSNIDWLPEAKRYAENFRGKMPRYHFQKYCGVPDWEVFREFLLFGWNRDKKMFTLPEQDATGRVTGIFQKREDGKNFGAIGSRGLTIPASWWEKWKEEKGGSTFYVPEGSSDTVAMTAAGLRAIGRPSASGKPELLAELFACLTEADTVIILGDNDKPKKEEEKGAGEKGVERIVDYLLNEANLACKVGGALAPVGAKDVRKWLTDSTRGDASWEDRGRELVASLVPIRTPEVPQKDRLIIRPLSEDQVEPIEWLIPGRIPKGKLTMFSGDGGVGKSTLTYHLAAKLSVGEPAFGEEYTSPPPCNTLFISSEDSYKDTVIPLILAEGGDTTRISCVESVQKVGKGGKAKHIQFGPDDVELLRNAIERDSSIRLVVIDPIASYVGRGKVNDNHQSELRGVLDPLQELALKTEVAIILISHVNKSSQSRNAAHRVAGSTAYVNTTRLMYIFSKDRFDTSRRLMMPAKHNLQGLKFTSLLFHQDGLAADEIERLRTHRQFQRVVKAGKYTEIASVLGKLVFDPPEERDANEEMSPDVKTTKKKSRVDECMNVIRKLLANEPKLVSEIDKYCIDKGYTLDNASKARTKLKEEGYRDSKKGILRGPTWWGYGEPDTWDTPTTPHESHDSPYSHDIHESHDIGNIRDYSMSGKSGDSCKSGESGNGHTNRISPSSPILELLKNCTLNGPN